MNLRSAGWTACGALHVSLSIATFITSFAISVGSCTTLDAFKDSLAVLFVNDLDERVFTLLTNIAPGWLGALGASEMARDSESWASWLILSKVGAIDGEAKTDTDLAKDSEAPLEQGERQQLVRVRSKEEPDAVRVLPEEARPVSRGEHEAVWSRGSAQAYDRLRLDLGRELDLRTNDSLRLALQTSVRSVAPVYSRLMLRRVFVKCESEHSTPRGPLEYTIFVFGDGDTYCYNIQGYHSGPGNGACDPSIGGTEGIYFKIDVSGVRQLCSCSKLVEPRATPCTAYNPEPFPLESLLFDHLKTLGFSAHVAQQGAGSAPGGQFPDDDGSLDRTATAVGVASARGAHSSRPRRLSRLLGVFGGSPRVPIEPEVSPRCSSAPSTSSTRGVRSVSVPQDIQANGAHAGDAHGTEGRIEGSAGLGGGLSVQMDTAHGASDGRADAGTGQGTSQPKSQRGTRTLGRLGRSNTLLLQWGLPTWTSKPRMQLETWETPSDEREGSVYSLLEGRPWRTPGWVLAASVSLIQILATVCLLLWASWHPPECTTPRFRQERFDVVVAREDAPRCVELYNSYVRSAHRASGVAVELDVSSEWQGARAIWMAGLETCFQSLPELGPRQVVGLGVAGSTEYLELHQQERLGLVWG